MRKWLSFLLCSLLVFSMWPATAGLAEGTETEADTDLWSAVKPLETTVVFLNTGAHPDDERSDLLAYLSRGLGVKTSSLIANRGEGGQNEIGRELGNGLGIIRSREMIEAAKITGVKAYHLSETTSDDIYDFGFSKTPEETLANWGEEETYERLIRFIRTYQPDIVMPSFRNVDSQHGHHRTMTILSERAFKDAADPEVFPEQLNEGLSVWQIKKLYLPAESAEKATTSFEIGGFDPIYRMTYPQLGEESRYMHKSQGMGNDIPAEPRKSHLELVQSVEPVEGKDELFAGIPYDFSDWAKKVTEKDIQVQLEKLQQELEGIVAAYPDRSKVFTASEKALKDVRQLNKKVGNSKLAAEMKNDLLHKLEIKEEQLELANFIASGLKAEAVAETGVLTRGETSTLRVSLTNEGKETVKKAEVTLRTPADWTVKGGRENWQLKPGQSAEAVFEVTVPEDAELYHPYDEPAIQAVVKYTEGGTDISHQLDIDKTIAVLPDVSLTLNPEDLVVNTADVKKEIPVAVTVKNYLPGKAEASISLEVPEGWATTEAVPVTLEKRGDTEEVTFTLTPPAEVKEGDFAVNAKAAVGENVWDSTVQEISYDHIGTFYNLYPASVNGVAFELNMDENRKIGYIDSEFDKVADYLTNAGLDITKLTEEDLASGDLSQYDTIVTGIRAYLSRKDLAEHNDRLHEYVKNGGHLVVQYHKPDDGWNAETTAPYPLKIGSPSIRWRVTDENAKVTVLQPESKLFNYPNKITDKDWDGWIQERGLYFPMEWDSKYQTFVSMADPNEEPFDGGILMAEYGKGTYLYTNLVFYRQIQGQVPGGYRIFTNLINY